MPEIRWLHFTDLHVGMNDADWLWPNAKHKIIKDLKDHYSEAGPWDLVLFTGDLVQQGKGELYDKLEADFLDPLWEVFDELGCAPTLLVVPGNHDLAWQDKSSPTMKSMERWHRDDDVQEDFWGENRYGYVDVVNNAFSAFHAWWTGSKYFPKDHYKAGKLPGDFSYTFEKDGFALGIIGLNSAFLQLTDAKDYEGRLELHHNQCKGACGDDYVDWLTGHHVNFLMTHHPAKWLHTTARGRMHGDFMEYFALHLCGHNHRTDLLQILRGGAEHSPLQWTGRSLFGLEKYEDGKIDREHGYVAGVLSSTGEARGMRFWPRRREERGNGWLLVPDYQVELPDERRTRVFPIQWLGENVAPAPDVTKAPPTGSFSDWICDKLKEILERRSELFSALSRVVSESAGTSAHTPDELCRLVIDRGFVSVWQDVVGKLDAFSGHRDELRRTLYLLAQAECKGAIIEQIQRMLEDGAPPEDFAIRIQQRYMNLMGLMLNTVFGVEFSGGEAFKKRLHMPSEVGLVGERLKLDVAKQLMRRFKIIAEQAVKNEVVQKNLSELEQSLKAYYVSKEPLIVEHQDENAIGIQYLVQFILPPEERSGSEVEGVIESMTQSGDRFINELLDIIMRRLDE